MKTGTELIAAERERQITKEGWTPEHDDSHYQGELYDAAWCYGSIRPLNSQTPAPKIWPWQPKWWKPTDDPVRNLTKSGALMRAEIDRLNRLVEKTAAEIDRLQSLNSARGGES